MNAQRTPNHDERTQAERPTQQPATPREVVVFSQDEMLIRRIAAEKGAQAVTIMTGKDFARTA